MKRFLLFTLYILSLIKLSLVSAFIGESADLDLYKNIDSGVIKIQNELVSSELKGSSFTINNILNRSSLPRYFDESSDFNLKELDALTKGSIKPIYSHLKIEFLQTNKFDTSNLVKITKIITGWYTDKNIKVENEIKSMNEIGSLGLYYDGDRSNSSYDLIIDIEKINDVIFSKNITYNGDGSINRAKLDFKNLLDNPRSFAQDQTNNLNSLQYNNGNIVNNITGALNTSSNQITISSDVINSIGSSNIISNSCLTGNLLQDSSNNIESKGIILNDKNLLNDINNQLTYGNNNNTSVGGQNTQSHQNPILNNGVSNGSSLFDPFPCSDIFCIKIDFVMYTQNLLTGGKSNSIETILSKNFKVADKIAATPLVTSEMPKTSFELSILKGLFLGRMIHLGVIVSFLPIPVLSLKKAGDFSNSGNIGKTDFSDEQLYSGIFKKYGLDYYSQNKLITDKTDLTLANCMFGDTSKCKYNLDKVNGYFDPNPEYSSLIDNSLKNDFLANFNNDLNALKDFSKELGDKIDTITKITNKFLNKVGN